MHHAQSNDFVVIGIRSECELEMMQGFGGLFLIEQD
jgi:hypothetical protein